MQVLFCVMVTAHLSGLAPVWSQKIQDEDRAREWLEDKDRTAQRLYAAAINAQFNFYTNLTRDNQDAAIVADELLAEFSTMVAQQADSFDWESFSNDSLRRQASRIRQFYHTHLSQEDRKKLNEIRNAMTQTYFGVKVANRPGDLSAATYSVSDGLARIIAFSRDWDEQQWAWVGYRNATRVVKDNYTELIRLENLAATRNEFADVGELWRYYSFEKREIKPDLGEVWNKIKPFYQHLHAYVRRKLIEAYPFRDFPSTGHIPAHILGTISGERWSYITEALPAEHTLSSDVTKRLKELGYTAKDLYRLAESFFASMGFDKLPESFWEDSVFERPKDRLVSCQALPWDFKDGKNFRVSACTDVGLTGLLSSNLLVSLVYYFISYKDQPFWFRTTPSEAFLGAIGQLPSSSIFTSKYLDANGLRSKENDKDDPDPEITFLMAQALQWMVSLPYSYLLELWRWEVFNGQTTADRYNTRWWELRCKYQGVSPPVRRTEKDFDPAANIKVLAHTRQIHLFLGFVLEYQMYSALCEKAGHTGPLHRCSLYGSKEAGTALRRLMQLGASVRWEDALAAINGTRKLDAQPLLDYFKPLQQWLENENRGRNVTWDEHCPPDLVDPQPPDVVDGPTPEAPNLDSCTTVAPSAALTVITLVVVYRHYAQEYP